MNTADKIIVRGSIKAVGEFSEVQGAEGQDPTGLPTTHQVRQRQGNDKAAGFDNAGS